MIWRVPWMLLVVTSVMVGQELPSVPVSKPTLATFAVFGAEVLADGVTTRVLSQRAYRETDPLAKPFVRAGMAGQIGAGLLGVGAAGGAWYVFHRTHHERMAKWFLRSVTAGEGLNDARQFSILRKSRR